MKKTFLLFTALLASFCLGQTLPTPIYEAKFEGSDWATPPGFTIETTNYSSYRSPDQFRNQNSALGCSSPHGEIKLEGINASLKQQGTMSFFVLYQNPTATPSSVTKINGVYPIMYLSSGTANASEGLMLGITESGKLAFKSYINSTTGVTQQSTEELYANQWHHFAISYQFGANGHITVYRNGKQMFHQNISHELINNTNPFEFFGFTAPGSTYKSSLSANLDEVRVYDIPFNAAEVKDLYTSYFAITKGSKIAKYDFNNSDFNDYFSNYPSIIVHPSVINYKTYTHYGVDNIGLELHKGNNAASTTYAVTGIKTNDLGDKFSVAFAYNRTSSLQANTSQTFTPIVSIPTETGDIAVGFVKASQKVAIRINGTEYPQDFSSYLPQYNHFAMTVDNEAKTIKLYFNASLIKTIDLASPISIKPSTSLFVGTDGKATPEYMFGQIDDLIIVNKLYTQEEVSKTQWQWYRNIHSYTDDSGTLATNNIKNKQNSIKAYPNPTTDIVKLSGKADVQVFDTSGRLIGSYKNADNVDLSAQKQGIYILKLNNANGIQSTKVIKR